MRLHRGNRLEVLADALAEVVAEPLASPFERETIVVQSAGMQRWLTMQLSERFGVWAGGEFPFPRSFVESVLTAVLDDEDAPKPLSPGELSFAIASALPELLPRPELAELRAYVSDDPHGEKLLELSSSIARSFDQYPVYRPDVVTAWEGGAGEGWQPLVWRAIVAKHGARHVAARAKRFFDRVGMLAERPKKIPARVSVFGVATMPPFYLTVLDALSGIADVHLFLLSPSREYWAEIRSRREIARHLRATDVSAEALGLLEGNPLLSSLGTSGRDFQVVLEGRVDYLEDERDRYVAKEPRTMLEAVQSDVLSLTHRGAADTPKLVLSKDDASIELHVCHGPARELEALRERLLSLFEADETLQPRDVIVMTPDIETYGPLVPAIFGGAPGAPGTIPIRVSDRSARTTSEWLGAFLALLDVAESRAEAPRVLDLFARRPLREKLGFSIDQWGELTELVAAVGIHWGFDDAHRRAEGQPAFATGTWRAGLDRWLLGYAMPLEERALHAGVMPYDDVEGDRAERVGTFAQAIDRLQRFVESVRVPHPLPAWRELFSSAIETFFAKDDDDAEVASVVRTAMSELVRRAEIAEFSAPITLSSLRRELVAILDASSSSHAFLSGGVTFCALLPMRSIPFRVVCLVGMNDGVFPRVDRLASFDLLAESRRHGDRSARDEDRYLFLEAILSARERLLLSHVGRSAKDGSALPPSVVVSELCDVLDESFAIEGDDRPDAVRSHVTIEHPLSPFSPAHFDGRDPRLRSHSQRDAAGARAAAGAKSIPSPLAAEALPRSRQFREVTLAELESLLSHPSRAFFERRLGARFPAEEGVLADREPIALSGLERHAARDRVLALCLEGRRDDEIDELLRASGELPPGALGDRELARLRGEARELAERTLATRGGARRAPRVVDLTLDDVRLTGVLRDLYPSAQVLHRPGKMRARALLVAWLRHLVLSSTRAPDEPSETALVVLPGATKQDREGLVVFGEVPSARAHLAELLSLVAMSDEAPLTFFPETSWAFASAEAGKELEAARKAWRPANPEHAGPGDAGDVHTARLVGERSPFEPDFRLARGSSHPTFEELARLVFGPLLAHRKGTT